MISYFKYTDGSAFTLDGVDYKGVVTVQNETAYAGSIYSPISKPLSAKQTFMAGAITNRLEFNYSRTSALSSKILPVEVYPKSVLDVTTLANIVETLNENNLAIFASGVGYDQNYSNPLFCTSDTNSFVSSVSSLTSGLISRKIFDTTLSLSGTLSAKTSRPITKESSVFITLSTGYKYFNGVESIQGRINSPIVPTLFPSTFIGMKESINNLVYDKFKGVLYQTTPSAVVIYNYDYETPNNTVSLIDDFDISKAGVVDDLSKTSYGRSYRTVVARASGANVFEIYQVTSAEVVKSYLIKDLGFDTIERTAQRFEDDVLVILGKVGDKLVLKTYDIDRLKINSIPLYDQPIDIKELPAYIKFSPFDSNICIFHFFSSSGLTRIELRSISGNKVNSPAAVITGRQFNLFARQSISTITTPINALDICPNTPRDILVYDVQFDVGEDVYSIVYANTYIKTNNAPIMKTIVPFDTASRYDGITIADSSIGLVINSALKNVIYDTITLYYLFNTVRRIDSNSIYTETTSNVKNVDPTNLLIYANESINIGVINRTIAEILALQTDLASKIDGSR
jgi:hypothetical protein